MTMRLSTGLINFLAKQGSIDDALRNGCIEIFTGAQPASADAAATGTLLATITANSAVRTAEVMATGSLTLTAGAAGSLNTLTVNGVDILGAIVPFNGTLGQTAIDIASQINRFGGNPEYTALAAGNVVTISALPGSGTGSNGFVVAATETTLTATTTNMAGGVAGANGLLFDSAVGGVLPKQASQVWSGLNAATGVAGWMRQHGSAADANAIDASAAVLRIDGAIGTSGAEMNLNSTAFVAGATTTLAAWSLTVPNQ
jgi:hypothetical protein